MYAINQQVAYDRPKVGESLMIGSGLGVIFRVLSDTTLGSVSIVEHTLAPKALAAPPHRHLHEDELSYILEGQIAVLQGNETSLAGAGSYVFKPRGVFHTFWNPGTETAHLLEIITPGGFENYFHELAPLVPENAPPNMSGLFALAHRYGLEFDMSHVPELIEQYGLHLG